MRYRSIVFVVILFSKHAFAISFKEILDQIEAHNAHRSLMHKSNKINEESRVMGSWGDPMLKVTAKNFPEGSLNRDESPMTGIEFSLSQKIALTPKYGKVKDSKQALADGTKFQAEDLKRQLILSLWEFSIKKRKLSEDRAIHQENIEWINKMLAVSKKLYGNGKISQQALLEVQIRKAELEAELQNISNDLIVLDQKLFYLHGQQAQSLNLSTVPWNVMNSIKDDVLDPVHESYKLKQVAAKKALIASKLNYIPDLTVSVGYTKRANIDGKGDFVSASIAIPLPFSSVKYATHSKAIEEKYRAEKDLKEYEQRKFRNISTLLEGIKKIENELGILKSKTIKFASNARSITSKSYGLGRASYFELLSSELKLQSLQLRKSMLKASLDYKKINLKYARGEKLYE